VDRAACHGSEHPPPPPDRPLAARGPGRKPWHILGENGWRILTENLQRPASLGHPRAARLPKAAHPLVTGRPRHTVPLAELRHRPLAAFEVLREPQPLFRRTRLHPGHPLGVNDVPGLLLTMCPGRTYPMSNRRIQPARTTSRVRHTRRRARA